MRLTTAEHLLRRGRFTEALDTLNIARIEVGERLSAETLRAVLLERTGQHEEGRLLAERLLKNGRLDPEHRSACEWSLGLVSFEEGKVDDAMSHFRRALSLADAAGDLRAACFCQLRLMNLLADRSGHQTVAPLLARVRQNVTRLGDSIVSAALHISMGELEAKRGLLDSAIRHTKLGQELLKKEENLWLEGVAENTLMAVAIMSADPHAGIRHGNRVVQLAAESGANALRRAALGNLGNLYFLTGDFTLSRQYLHLAQQVLPTTGSLSNGTLESLAVLSLAEGDFDGASQFLTEMEAAVRNEADWMIYSNRHSRLTLVELMTRQGRLPQALKEIDNVVQLAERSGDHQLSFHSLLVKAELLLETGASNKAGAILSEIITDLPTQSADMHAKYEKAVFASVARSGQPECARNHFDRAVRIYRGLHHIPGQLEVSRSWAAISEVTGTHANAIRDGLIHKPGNVLQNVAALLLHAGRPELVATGLVAIVEDADGVLSASAVSRGTDGSVETLAAFAHPDRSEDAPVVERSFAIGSARNRAVEVRLTARSNIETIAILNAVTLLLSTVRDLERAHAEREERLTLWPLEDLPPDGEQTVVMGRLSEVMTMARRVATTNIGVLITGESGTGKEILARAIHRYSPRADKPFVPFNCAAIPREMLESQLFGHRRGAFTGADRDNPGVIRAAKDGTLLLDEIGELSPELQPKLLRFLESGEICPLGEPHPQTVDVRIIAATNANLEELVQAGRFREDLFYRLNVIPLSIPPLRERRDEIPALVHHFVGRATQEFGKSRLRLAEETMEHLVLYAWPGNIRQLNNELRRVIALADSGTTIRPSALSKEIVRASLKASRPNGAPEISVVLTEKLHTALSRIEREMIKAALTTNEGKVDAAARALGISRKGLYLKRQRLGL
jgi:DNA-binding NtrC family response regulator/tetratricopeptide (TPR) repeat protein